MRLTATTNGALRVMMALNTDRPVTMSEMATSLNMAQPTVVKTCHELMLAGFIAGRRGPHGGYRLARDAREIGVLDVVDLFEPPGEMFPCRIGTDDPCPLAPECGLRDTCERAYRAFRSQLAPLRIADLGDGPQGRA